MRAVASPLDRRDPIADRGHAATAAVTMSWLWAACRNTSVRRTTGTASDDMTSASTWPGPTEGSWSMSPTIKRAALSGTAFKAHSRPKPARLLSPAATTITPPRFKLTPGRTLHLSCRKPPKKPNIHADRESSGEPLSQCGITRADHDAITDWICGWYAGVAAFLHVWRPSAKLQLPPRKDSGLSLDLPDPSIVIAGPGNVIFGFPAAQKFVCKRTAGT